MADTDIDTKKCPDCAEYVKAEARVCRFCRFDFVEHEVEVATARRFFDDNRDKLLVWVAQQAEAAPLPPSVGKVPGMGNGKTKKALAETVTSRQGTDPVLLAVFAQGFGPQALVLTASHLFAITATGRLKTLCDLSDIVGYKFLRPFGHLRLWTSSGKYIRIEGIAKEDRPLLSGYLAARQSVTEHHIEGVCAQLAMGRYRPDFMDECPDAIVTELRILKAELEAIDPPPEAASGDAVVALISKFSE